MYTLYRWSHGGGPWPGAPSIVSLHTVSCLAHPAWILLYYLGFPFQTVDQEDGWKFFLCAGEIGQVFHSTSCNSIRGIGSSMLALQDWRVSEWDFLWQITHFPNMRLSTYGNTICFVYNNRHIISRHILLGFLFGLAFWLHIISVIILNQPSEYSPTFSVCLSV